MLVTVKKWGNSASVRIPAALMEAAKLHVDATVDLREEGGRLIIEPVQKPSYDLNALLEKITADNLHAEVDFSPAIGKELL